MVGVDDLVTDFKWIHSEVDGPVIVLTRSSEGQAGIAFQERDCLANCELVQEGTYRPGMRNWGFCPESPGFACAFPSRTTCPLHSGRVSGQFVPGESLHSR